MICAKRLNILAFILPMLLLCGCSTIEGEFPSLERRPFEQNNPVVAPAVVPTPVAARLSGELAQKVSALQARHATASSAFDSLLPGVRAIAQSASNAPFGGEAWINAHLQVSRLDSQRADAVTALSEMDALITAQTEAESQGAITLFSPLLQPVQTAMAEKVEKQNQEIEQLSKIIGL